MQNQKKSFQMQSKFLREDIRIWVKRKDVIVFIVPRSASLLSSMLDCRYYYLQLHSINLNFTFFLEISTYILYVLFNDGTRNTRLQYTINKNLLRNHCLSLGGKRWQMAKRIFGERCAASNGKYICQVEREENSVTTWFYKKTNYYLFFFRTDT